jgi:heterodisulfide reductase subunit C
MPTLNPWRFLRNLGGILILGGVAMAVWRCRADPLRKRTRTPADRLARVLLLAMVVSGILLESVQILSPSIFDAMVEDYAFSDDPQEIEALKAYWASSWGSGVASTIPTGDYQTLAEGQEMHAAFCSDCHDRPQSAFLSYPFSRALKPLAGRLDRLGLERLLWYLHFITACLGLALLPFSKFFHLLATPISLMVRAGGPAEATAPALRSMRRAMGLDACTHCGVCSQHCAVAVIYQAIPNPAILPSEKIGALKSGAMDDRTPLAFNLVEGSFICTACGRCTQWCPSGIDLQDLWLAAQKDLVRRGLGPAHDWIQSQNAAQWAARARSEPLRPAHPAHTLGLSDNPETFWACVQCTTCTNVCPVVAVAEDPQRDLDLTPQQVMNLLRLQLRELALGSRMVWDCVTCYQCQEHCPQGVAVADILYELRNEAVRRLPPLEPRAQCPAEAQREA